MTTNPWLTPSMNFSHGFSCCAAPMACLVTATTTSGGWPASCGGAAEHLEEAVAGTEGQTNSTAADVYDADPGTAVTGTLHENRRARSPSRRSPGRRRTPRPPSSSSAPRSPVTASTRCSAAPAARRPAARGRRRRDEAGHRRRPAAEPLAEVHRRGEPRVRRRRRDARAGAGRLPPHARSVERGPRPAGRPAGGAHLRAQPADPRRHAPAQHGIRAGRGAQRRARA